MSDEALRVVLCWHMHQPDYREAFTGQFQMPWTYLHAIKGYADMAAHVEHAKGATAVFDFSPVLLDQIEDYAGRLRQYLQTGVPLRDALLDALASPVLPTGEDERRGLLRACLAVNSHRLEPRFPAYRRLAQMARSWLEHGLSPDYVEDRLIVDLLVWFHIVWLGETVRRDDRRVDQLVSRGSGFTLADRRLLITLIADVLEDLPSRYRRLADNGRIETATCPYHHPILPLLLDFESALEARPGLTLPAAARYPGGEQRARWHLDSAAIRHKQTFGSTPAGCWPAEGALSEQSLALLSGSGFRWTASGQAVLRNSLATGHHDSDSLHRPYRLQGQGPVCFFRDDGLSDLIGFTYQSWHADDAVADLVRHLENIARKPAESGRVVPIILDGENPWEHYPDSGFHFVGALYRALAEHPGLEMTTFSRCLDDPAVPVRTLDRLCAGSWVYGSLDTWIGQEDKNRAWDLLVSAKRAWDAAPDPVREQTAHKLAVCEGSDWFWWPGDQNPDVSVSRFERMFRLHLADLYRLLGQTPPERLAHPFSRGGGSAESGGTMRPSV